MRHLLHPFEKAFLSAFLVLPLLTCACGDDDSSDFEAPSSSSAQDDILGGDEYKDSSAIGDKYKTQNGTVTILKGEYEDSRNGKTYKTVQFASYIWMAENLAYENSYSTCYDDKSANCEKNGRLYQDFDPESACPDGFTLPSEADYKYMAKVAGNLTETSFGFNPQMAGYCTEDGDKLNCSEVDKNAYLITSNFSFIRITNDGKVNFGKTKNESYYSVRCMKVSHFVETDKQLPTCDSTTYERLDEIFVAAKGKNYSCNGKRWTVRDGTWCPSRDKGEKHYYKDTLYICDGYDWVLASMNDAGAECTEENQWDIQKLNGQRYVCDDSTWRLPTTMETQIGLCTKDNIREMGAVTKSGDTTNYICDTTGWRPSVLTDSIGECTAENNWKHKSSYGVAYLCNDSTWRKAVYPEDSLGFCTPNRNATIDSIYLYSTDNYSAYYCDSTKWRRAVLTDFAGECDSTRFFKTYNFRDTVFACRTTKKWSKLSSIEKDIGVCSPKINGRIDSARTDSTAYYCDSTAWRKAVITDFAGKCDSTKFYKTFAYKDTLYACRTTKSWSKFTSVEQDIGICSPKIIGRIDTIKTESSGYICDSTGWRVASITDYYGACDSSKLYSEKPYKGDKYGCTNARSWEKLTYPSTVFGLCTPTLHMQLKQDNNGPEYICDSVWRRATAEEVLGACDASKDGTTREFSSTQYVCDNGSWRTLKKLELQLGPCYKGNMDEQKVLESTPYICNDTGWTKQRLEDVFGSCGYDDRGKLAELAGVQYACKYPNWKKLDSIELILGACITNVNTSYYKIYQVGDDYYHCVDETWRIASYEYALNSIDKCNPEIYGKITEYRGKQYFCSESNNWQEYSELEQVFGLCSPSVIEDIRQYGGKTYGCTYGNSVTNHRIYYWRLEDARDAELGFCHGTGFTWKVYNGKDYACSTDSDGKWETGSFWGMYYRCSETYPVKLGVTVGFEGQHYYCNVDVSSISEADHGWYALQAIDSVKGPCYSDVFGDTLTFEGNLYYCGKNAKKYYRWILAKSPADIYGKCTTSKEGETGAFNGMNVECSGGVWHRASKDYGTLTDSQGNEYRTIKIGNQTWMADNLKLSLSITSNSWCPGGSVANCASKGRLYDWASAMQLAPDAALHTVVAPTNYNSYQGICPDGWRLPTNEDWSRLLEGRELSELTKKTVSAYDSLHNDLYGFSAFPTGYYKMPTSNTGSATFTDNVIAFWTVSEYDADEAYTGRMATNLDVTQLKTSGFAIRCIKK